MTKSVAVMAVAVVLVTACSKEQRSTLDSAAGSAVDVVRTELSVIDVDMGRHVNAEKKIVDGTDTFATSDTIFASVHTSGTAKEGQLTANWTFPDGSTLDQKAETPVAEGMNYAAFFVTKAGGLPKGKYTFRVIVDGREVRSKDVTVK